MGLKEIIEIKEKLENAFGRERRNIYLVTELWDSFYEDVEKAIKEIVEEIEKVNKTLGNGKKLPLLPENELNTRLRSLYSLIRDLYKKITTHRIRKITILILDAILNEKDFSEIDRSNFTEIEKKYSEVLYNVLKRFYKDVMKYVNLMEEEEEKDELEEKVESTIEEEKEEEKFEKKEEEKRKEEKREIIKLPLFDYNVRMGRIIKDIDQFLWKDKKVYGPFKKEDVIIMPSDLILYLSEKDVLKEIFIRIDIKEDLNIK